MHMLEKWIDVKELAAPRDGGMKVTDGSVVDEQTLESRLGLSTQPFSRAIRPVVVDLCE